MGKILIIKNSDFSSVAVEQVTFGPEEIWDNLTQNVIYSDKISQFLHYSTFINAYQILDTGYNDSYIFIVDISSYKGGQLRFTHKPNPKSENYDESAYWSCFASDVITTDLASITETTNNFATVASYIDGTLNKDETTTQSITEILQIPLKTKYLVSFYNERYDFKIECKK